MFYYLENEAWTNTAVDGVVLTTSLLAMASGALAPEGLTLLGELIYTMETGGAILAMGARFVDINQPDDPFLQEIRDVMDMSAGAMGFVAITGRAAYWLSPTRIETIGLLGEAVNVEHALSVTNRIAALDQSLALLNSSPALLADLMTNKPALTLSILEVLLYGSRDIIALQGALPAETRAAMDLLLSHLSAVERLINAGANKAVVEAFLTLPEELKVTFLEDVEFAGVAFWESFNAIPDGGGVRAWEALRQTALKTDVTWINRVSDWLGHGLRSTKEGDLVHLLDVNDRIVGTIRNETLLVTNHPANWGISGFSGSPVGEVVNGCQLYSDGTMSFFKRVPDLSGFTEVERGYLTASPKAHCPEKHGSGVTDEALKFRTETGIAPNGEYGNPVNGTRFYSNTEIKACMIELGPGTPAFAANLNSAGDRSVILNYDMGMSLVEGYRIGGNSLEGDIQLVMAIWWKDGATQQWFLRTMYPVLQ